MGDKSTGNEPDWAKIRGEYVNSNVSLKALAAKYGVTVGTIQKHSAKGKWSEKRKKLKADKEEKVSDKLHERDVKQTIKDIERVCRAAGKLIDKINIAIAQLDKAVYISEDKKNISTKESMQEDGATVVDQTVKRSIKTRRYKTLADTKRMSEISKTLLNVKQVLTGEDGSADETESSGIIEIYGQDMIDEHEKDDGLATAGEMDGTDAARDMEAAAQASVNAPASGG